MGTRVEKTHIFRTTVTDQKRDEKEKIREQKRAESKQAQALALKLAERIDTLAEKTEKPKHQNGYEVFNFNIKGCFRFNDVKSNHDPVVVMKFEFCAHSARLLRKLDHVLLWILSTNTGL